MIHDETNEDFFPDLEYAQKQKVPLHEMNKTVKSKIAEQKYSYLTSDVFNTTGHGMIRQKYGLVPPN